MYDGPTVRGRIDGLVDHKGFLDFETSLKGDYQMGEQEKKTLGIEAQQSFKVGGEFGKLIESAYCSTRARTTP